MNLRSLLLPLCAGLCVCAACVALGQWQLRRAGYKDALRVHFAAAGIAHPLQRADLLTEWQRVTLRGQWMADRSVLLDNRLRDRLAGFEVLTPLKLDHDGGIVIVNRGWVAANGDRSKLPRIATPTGRVEISGMTLAAVSPGFSLAAPRQDGAIWQKADLASFERLLGGRVGAWLIRQESSAADGLDRAWPAPDFGADKHRAYALQWFAMAATALGLTLWYGRKLLLRRPARSSIVSPTEILPS